MRLPRFVDTNVQPATTSKSYDIVDSSGKTLETVSVPWYTSRVTAATASLLMGFSDMNTWYHSMVVTVKKPMSYGLQVLANYTWSKTMDMGEVGGLSGTFNGTDVPIDPNNHKAEYSRSDLNMKNRFVGSLVWAPKFKTPAAAIDYVANGWSLSGSFTAQTGFPITPLMTNYPSSALSSPGISGNGGLSGASVSWLNSVTAVRTPQLSCNYFPGPGLRNVDARLSRDFDLTEKLKLQFYVEAFNLMNYQNILSVNNKYATYVGSGVSNATVDCSAHANGCIAPYIGATDFLGTPTSTTGVLYGPRQAQFVAKLLF